MRGSIFYICPENRDIIKNFWDELLALDELGANFPFHRPHHSIGCIIGTVFCTSIKLVEDIT